tara:strand:+ start:360 stop:1490 length:1131 start_codon:yes stop_codon:yes gene_type:complete
MLKKYVRQLNPIQENKIEPIVKVQKLYEADTKAAFDMERVIVSAAGGPKFTSKLIRNSDKVGERIAKKLKLKGLGGSMPKNTYPASKEWNKYFAPGKAKGSTLTPKTDIIIGKKKVSVKTGDAVLMSGEAKEATATFYTAMDNTGTVSDAVKKLRNHIDNLLPSTDMTKYGIKGSKTDLVQAGKFAEVEILKKADEAHHAFKEDMRAVFANSPDFSREFTFEAMTGKVKFGGNDGTADHFLVTDYEGLKPTIHKVTSSSDAYVGKIMKYVNPDVTFKSGSKKVTKDGVETKTGYYTFWSAVKVGVKMVIEEEIRNGDLLTEGILDIVKRGFAKAVSWVKNFFQKIYNLISKSYKTLLEFMVLEPEVTFNNKISWPN